MGVYRILDSLLPTQNADGGWGALKGKQSNTEATSFALLALSTLNEAALATHIDRGLDWLVTRQNTDGSWPWTEQIREGSWATALAMLALAFFEPHHQSALRGRSWLLRQQGRKLGWYASLLYRFAPHKMSIQLNPNLQGWAWRPGTFSWVEPTAYALMALKKLQLVSEVSQATERIQQGEFLLHDRMCIGGGWNYGNVIVLGEQLHPYPDTTALGLIVLQNRHHEEAIQQSLQALRNMLTQVESGLALSWSILCLALYGDDVSLWRERLTTIYAKTGFLNETKTLALALLALGDRADLFKV